MGYINKKDWEFLEIEKPEKVNNCFNAIFKYMEHENLNKDDFSSTGWNLSDKITKIDDQIYAKEISICSSGNEPKIYAHVLDNNDHSLFWVCLLETSPAAYGKAAAITGFFLEKFNLYIDINFNFK